MSDTTSRSNTQIIRILLIVLTVVGISILFDRVFKKTLFAIKDSKSEISQHGEINEEKEYKEEGE